MIEAILIWIIFGGIVGLIVSFFDKYGSPRGVLPKILIGILGSVIGNFIANLLGIAVTAGFTLSNFAVSVLGALLLLFALRRVY